MGRYFRTATPQNVDFMYKLPEEMMFKATQQASQDITQNQAATYSLYDKLHLNALAGDKQRAREILGGYEDQINGLAQQLQNNPLEFRRKSGDIIALSRKLNKDFTNGEAAAIGNNYALVSEWEKRQIENKDIKDKESIILAKNKWLKDYELNGGVNWNPTTGTGVSVPLEELYNTVDVQAKYDKYAKDKLAHIMSTATTGTDGKYIYKEGETTVTKSKEEIIADLKNRFEVDDESQKFLKQRSDIGAISGWYDGQGKLRTDKDSSLATMLGNSAESYWQKDVTAKTKSMSTNGYGVKAYDPKNQVFVNPTTGAYVSTPSLPATTTDGLLTEAAALREQGTVLAQNASANLMQSFKERINTLPKEFKRTFDTKLRSAFEKAKTGNVTELKDLYTSMGVDNDQVKNIVYQIQENSRKALNIEVQKNYFNDLAKKMLNKPGVTDADIKAKADELMQKADNLHQPDLYETNGAGFENAEEIAAGLKQVTSFIDQGTMPKNVIVQETDADGKITNTPMTGQAFAEYLQKKNKVVTTVTDPNTELETERTKDGKPMTKRIVTKVLQNVNGIDKPYKVKYDAGLSVFIDPKEYQFTKLEEAVNKNRPDIDLNNAIEEANNSAFALRSAAKKTGQGFEVPQFQMGNGVYYKPPVDDNGVGSIVIDFGEMTKVKMDGKVIVTDHIEAPEDKKYIRELAKQRIN